MFSRINRLPTGRIIQRACLSTKSNPNNINFPNPTQEIPDVETFFQRIGRDCIEHKEHFPNWHLLFNTSSREMKEKGIDVQSRRYILKQLQKFKDGEKILEIKKGKKSFFGGEYKRKETMARMHAAERKERYAKLEADDEARAAAKKAAQKAQKEAQQNA